MASMLNAKSGITFDQAVVIIAGTTGRQFSLSALREFIAEGKLETYEFDGQQVINARSLRRYILKESGIDYRQWLASQVAKTMHHIRKRTGED